MGSVCLTERYGSTIGASRAWRAVATTASSFASGALSATGAPVAATFVYEVGVTAAASRSEFEDRCVSRCPRRRIGVERRMPRLSSTRLRSLLALRDIIG